MSTVIDEFFGVVNKNFISQRDMRAEAICACTNYSSKYRFDFFENTLRRVAGAISA